MKRVYKIEYTDDWINVSYQPYGPLETAFVIRRDLDLAPDIAETYCAALNAIEAAKQKPTNKVRKPAKRKKKA